MAIAGIIAMKPDILILDEPTVGLDPVAKKEILEKIKKYQESRKATIIIVSHDANIVANYTDKVLILDNGKIAKYDFKDKVFSSQEEIEKLGLEIPKVTRIFHKLKERGVQVNTNIYEMEEAKREIISLLKRYKNNEEGV